MNLRERTNVWMHSISCPKGWLEWGQGLEWIHISFESLTVIFSFPNLYNINLLWTTGLSSFFWSYVESGSVKIERRFDMKGEGVHDWEEHPKVRPVDLPFFSFDQRQVKVSMMLFMSLNGWSNNKRQRTPGSTVDRNGLIPFPFSAVAWKWKGKQQRKGQESISICLPSAGSLSFPLIHRSPERVNHAMETVIENESDVGRTSNGSQRPTELSMPINKKIPSFICLGILMRDPSDGIFYSREISLRFRSLLQIQPSSFSYEPWALSRRMEVESKEEICECMLLGSFPAVIFFLNLWQGYYVEATKEPLKLFFFTFQIPFLELHSYSSLILDAAHERKGRKEE